MRFQHRSFPVKFAKILRTPPFTEQLQWLLPQNKIVKKKQEKRRYVSISIFLYITLSVSSSSEFDFLKIFLMFSYKKVSCL